jgi:hypothetical protein
LAAADAFLAAARDGRVPDVREEGSSDVGTTFAAARAAAAARPLDAAALDCARAWLRSSFAADGHFLTRGLALRMGLELHAARAVALDATTMSAYSDANAWLRHYGAFIECSAVDSPLVQYTRLCQRVAQLCHFHMKKAIREHVVRKRLITDKELAEHVFADVDKLMYSSAQSEAELRAEWTTFEEKWGDRVPAFVAYFRKNWMSDRWLRAWASFQRAAVATYWINTTNAAEGFFKVAKRVLLLGRRAIDFMSALRLLVGVPDGGGSVDVSYVRKLLDRCRRVRAAREPPAHRLHVKHLQGAISDILSRDGGDGSAVTASERDLDRGIVRVMPRAGAVYIAPKAGGE